MKLRRILRPPWLGSFGIALKSQRMPKQPLRRLASAAWRAAEGFAYSSGTHPVSGGRSSPRGALGREGAPRCLWALSHPKAYFFQRLGEESSDGLERG